MPGRIWDFLTQVIANVIAWGSDMLVKAQKAGSDFISGVVNFVKTLPGKIKDFIDRIIRNVTSFATNMGNKAKEAGQGFFDKLVEVVTGLPNKMKEIGGNIVDGIWKGISSGWNWLKEKVGGLVDSFLGGIKDALGIHSPSRKFKWLAEMCVAGFDEGMLWSSIFVTLLANKIKIFCANIPAAFFPLALNLRTDSAHYAHRASKGVLYPL